MDAAVHLVQYITKMLFNWTGIQKLKLLMSGIYLLQLCNIICAFQVAAQQVAVWTVSNRRSEDLREYKQ